MVDYEEDFLQKITDVRWGGAQWFGVEGPLYGLGSSRSTFEIDFPDQAAGTPGFITVDTTGTTINFAPYLFPKSSPFGPYIVRASDLAQKLRTNAGAQVTAFGVKGVATATGTLMLFQLNSQFPSSTFRVRVRLNGPIGTALIFVNCFTVARNWLKAGRSFRDSSEISAASRQECTWESGASGPTDFRIDPSSLAVTGPF